MEIKQALYTAMRFNFLYAGRYVFRTGWTYPESYIPYNMVRYIVKGDAVFIIDGRKIVVHEKQIVYIPEGCRLACSTLGDYFEFYSIRFRLSTQMEAGDFLSDYFHIKTVTKVRQEAGVLPYFEELYQNAVTSTAQNAGKMFRIRGNLELIVAWLVEHSGDTVPENDSRPEASHMADALQHREASSRRYKQDPRIRVVMDYLNSHMDEQFSLEFLSEMVGICKSSLRRLFKEQSGKTVGEYVVELRMSTAARQLLISDKPISTIAYEVGYENPGYFTRVFRGYFGTSPYEYRRNARI